MEVSFTSNMFYLRYLGRMLAVAKEAIDGKIIGTIPTQIISYESIKSISLDVKDQSIESRRRSIVWHRSPDYKSPYSEKVKDHENDEIDDFFDALNK